VNATSSKILELLKLLQCITAYLQQALIWGYLERQYASLMLFCMAVLLETIYQSCYVGMLFSSVNLLHQVLCLSAFLTLLLLFPTVVFQQFPKSNKPGWLTR